MTGYKPPRPWMQLTDAFAFLDNVMVSHDGDILQMPD